MSRKVNLAESEKDYEDGNLVNGDTAFYIKNLYTPMSASCIMKIIFYLIKQLGARNGYSLPLYCT